MADILPERFIRRTVDLAKVQSLYDRNLFQQAFRETSDFWNAATRLDDLSTSDLVLATRLSARLGGFRLSRWLARAAFDRDSENALVQYYTCHIVRKGWKLFDDFRAMEANPELKDADPDTQASWLAYSAVRWASIRDFERAHKCIERARFWNADESWVSSCESDVFGMEDRWPEALTSAEQSWEINPGAPFAARSLAGSLMNLRRVREAAERLAAAAEQSESFELPMLACWYLCALAETCDQEERIQVLSRATELANRMPELAPLADRETRAVFARTRLDIAQLADDHQGMEHWAEEARSPFHRKVVKNLRDNPAGLRIRLPFRGSVQKHDECLPTSIGSAMAAMGLNIDADAMAAEITFGGTAEWAAAEWLEKRGLHVRFFVATPEVSVLLIKAGFAFVVTLEYDSAAHAVAVVGLDEASGTLIVHDPQSFRNSEYLVSAIGKNEKPLGPAAMVAVPQEKISLLEQLLPRPDSEAAAAREAHHRAEVLHGASEMRQIVVMLAAQHPSHPITLLLQAFQDHKDGHIGSALAQLQNLLRDFPGSAPVRANLLSCCRSLGNTAMMRKTLADVVEHGILPGIQSQQDWVHPPSGYAAEYADLLRSSAQTRDQSRKMLHALIRRHHTCASAWHILGDLLWDERDVEGAQLGYRISAYLADTSEHYARAYCNALGYRGREEEGLEWLAQRVRRFGSSSHAAATWVTWISSLEAWGRPERALAAAQESLTHYSASAELLAFLVPFFGRMGDWAAAEERLLQLERSGNVALFREAAAAFYQMRGDLAKAIENAEAGLREDPFSMRVRYKLVELLAARDGAPAAVERAKTWMEDHPAHDEMEELYCRQLDRVSYTSWRKYSVVLRRVKRNPEDGWAWRELAFCAIFDFERADEKRRKRQASRISRYLDQCDRIAPGDAATLRVHAQWGEARNEWAQAVELWLEAIDHDPASMYAYQQAWNCSSRLDQERRRAIWIRMESMLLRQPGRLNVAQEMIMLVARRFGVALAEESVSRWNEVRPDDPEIVEAHVDLLLNYGHGRTDYDRALELVLPGLQRFPFQVGLRFSHAATLRSLGRFQEAEQVLNEIIRRHPDNASAETQIAWVMHRHGQTDDALHRLEMARERYPQNTGLPQAQVEILIDANRLREARERIFRATQRFPAEVGWRENAIRLLLDCGDPDGAVQTARDGVTEHPRGAYLWLLLGKTLYQLPRFAAQGEIESCFRRSMALNAGLFEAADYLAILLTKQRRYAEAEEIMLRVEKRISFPSQAQARVAWIHRQDGQKHGALEEMVSVVSQSPWYEWGWKVLLDWIVEDKSWDSARSLLAQLPPELRTNISVRQRRLEVLQLAGLPTQELDNEWNSLLHDFPEEASLHLIRYDTLRDSKRWSEAVETLKAVRTVDPDSPYVLARWVEVLVHEQKKDESISTLMKIFFAEVEPSTWPAEFAWTSIKKNLYEVDAYQRARVQLEQGQRPTEQAIFILAGHALEHGESNKRAIQPFFRTWFPDRGAREALRLLKIIESHPHTREIDRSSLLRNLSDFGYKRTVVNYWGKNKKYVEGEPRSWAEVGRALTALRRRRAGRKLMAGWRGRSGVAMWVVANYVKCCSGTNSRQLKEVRSACHDALAGLPHDSCARYLAYKEAEACVLLGDKEGFLETRKRHQAYFDGKLEQHEWFATEAKHLLAELPVMARFLEANEMKAYRKKIGELRWERFRLKLSAPVLDWQIDLRSWWIIFALLWLLAQFFRNF